MHGLFSKRFHTALQQKKIAYPSFSRVLRKRMAMVCRDHMVSWESYDGGSDTEDEAVLALKKAYGRDALRVQDEESGGDREATGFADFLVFAYPHSVLDSVEAYYRLLPENRQQAFQAELNSILSEESAAWRMSDGRMYMVDSRFLDSLKDQQQDEMRREGFLGAHEEFVDARSYLQSGDVDDAIHKANCAFESALKSLLNQREGTADDLLKRMREETDLLDGVPEQAQRAMVSKVLQALPVLRHKVGGHGQGAEALNIPRAYGDLAVNLCATYIKFLLDLKRELAPPNEAPLIDEDDEIPF